MACLEKNKRYFLVAKFGGKKRWAETKKGLNLNLFTGDQDKEQRLKNKALLSWWTNESH